MKVVESELFYSGEDFSQEQVAYLPLDANDIAFQEDARNYESNDKEIDFLHLIDIDENLNILQNKSTIQIEVSKEDTYPKEVSQNVVKETALLDELENSSHNKTQHETNFND